LSPDGGRLYVTTARLGLSTGELASAPWSGALLSLPYPSGMNGMEGARDG